jgi:hypothetical protein
VPPLAQEPAEQRSPHQMLKRLGQLFDLKQFHHRHRQVFRGDPKLVAFEVLHG